MGANVPDVARGISLMRTQRMREHFFHRHGFEVDQETAAQMLVNGEVGCVPIKYRDDWGGQGAHLEAGVQGAVRHFRDSQTLQHNRALRAVRGSGIDSRRRVSSECDAALCLLQQRVPIQLSLDELDAVCDRWSRIDDGHLGYMLRRVEHKLFSRVWG